MTQTVPSKTIHTLANHSEIQTGDIILLQKTIFAGYAQQAIVRLQQLSKLSYGSKDTTHVVLCIGKDHNNEPLIAHITESRQVTCSYQREPLSQLLIRDGADRNMMVYRHKQPQIRSEIARIAAQKPGVDGDQAAENYYQWRSWKALQALLSGPNPDQKASLNMDEKAVNDQALLSQNSVCSIFAAEIINAACQLIDHQGHLPATLVTPKGLEHYLYLNDAFHLLTYQAQTPLTYYYLTCQTEHKLRQSTTSSYNNVEDTATWHWIKRIRQTLPFTWALSAHSKSLTSNTSQPTVSTHEQASIYQLFYQELERCKQARLQADSIDETRAQRLFKQHLMFQAMYVGYNNKILRNALKKSHMIENSQTFSEKHANYPTTSGATNHFWQHNIDSLSHKLVNIVTRTKQFFMS